MFSEKSHRFLVCGFRLYQPYLQHFARILGDQKLNEGELFLTLADRRRILVVVVGVFNLCFDSKVLILEDCLYVPNVHRNLISATYLGKHGYCFILKDNVVIKKDKVFICFGNIVNGHFNS